MIIEQLDVDIRQFMLMIFEFKGELKIIMGQLKEAPHKLQKQHGYYYDDGNYVE